ncbi:MAG TPA: SDR family oxidoreductase [Anaerolineales bacterium]|jgi:NAD(P)-dependent dehydrogenase (short-subunit alcohol dehydrogenase family)
MNNPVVVISGATGAAGTSAARAFARQGASLALLSSDRSKLDTLAGELNLSPARLLLHAGDLSNAEEVKASATFVHSKFGRADILLHLVGGWTGGKTLAETPSSDLQAMVSQHLWTTFHLVQAFVPGMVHNGWGRVIIISSPVATQTPAKMGAYAVGKAAEDALLLTLAQEVKETGVTANIIQVRSIDAAGTGKGTNLDEIVSAMLYLCSDSAASINGARLPLF